MGDKDASSLLEQVSRRKLILAGIAHLAATRVAPALVLEWNPFVAHAQPAMAAVDEEIQAAWAAVDEDKLVKLVMDLASIPSPLGQEEAVATKFLDHMRREGLAAHLQSFAPGRCNVVGVHEGSGGGRSLMLNGHLETGGSNSVFATPRIEAKGWISGQGVWNMKGSLAAYLAAVTAIRKAGLGLAGDVVIAGTAGAWDEFPVDSRMKSNVSQGFGMGTRHMLSRGTVADFCIVGEPTSFKLVREQFEMNMVRVDVSVEHSYAGKVIEDWTGAVWREPGSSAVERCADVIQALRAWMPRYQRRNALRNVTPPMGITAVEGGEPWTPFPSTAGSIFLLASNLPGKAATGLLAEIKEVIAESVKGDPHVKVRAEFVVANPGRLVTGDSPLVAALQSAHSDVFGGRPDDAVAQWYSDALPLNHYGIPSVNYGPVGKASLDGEWVSIADLVRCARVYIDVIARICGRRNADENDGIR